MDISTENYMKQKGTTQQLTHISDKVQTVPCFQKHVQERAADGEGWLIGDEAGGEGRGRRGNLVLD